MSALTIPMAVIRSAQTLLDHTPVTATQDIDLMPMEEDVSLYHVMTISGAHIIMLEFVSRTGDDIDECIINGPNICDQVCTNTEGSFTCGCEEGYVLDTHRALCSGINCCCSYCQVLVTFHRNHLLWICCPQ